MSMTGWREICSLADILPDTGVCADLGRQIAVFRVDDAVYAIDNRDPGSGANVLSRGIVGDIGGELVVASPIYKHHFSLATGRCLEEPQLSVATHECRVVEGRVWVRVAGQESGGGTARRRLVVIGNGMAGMRTVEELLEIAPDLYDIEVFGAEPHGNYNRILLSPLLAGEKRVEEIILHPLEWYAEHGVTLHAGDPVVEIDRRRRRVRSERGVEVGYDRLLLATGSTPVTLAVPGADLPGVVTFRDLADVDAMVQAARRHRRAVVIGGGLLGLEAANGLTARGMEVTVVHAHAKLMEKQLDAAAAGMLQLSMEARGIRFRMQARTAAILGNALGNDLANGSGNGSGESRVTGLRFEDGQSVDADLVVVAIGVRPNISLALEAGLRCERGVVVDDTLQTFDPSIYAVGECVQHRQATYGLVAPLWEQARVCAAHLAEWGATRYGGSLTSTHLKVTGIQVFSAGSLGRNAGTESLVFNDAGRGVYKHLLIEDDRVRGAVLYGDTSDGPWYAELMRQGSSIGSMREHLLFGERFAASRG